VDYNAPEAIGVSIIGAAQIGADIATTVFPYFAELKIKSPKFRKRMIKFVAGGIGYLDIEAMADVNITGFENRIPKRFRSKQNVSLDGLSTDQANPSY
jgi:DNA topoisomerase VI subunit B